jgi:hypothetical protein
VTGTVTSAVVEDVATVAVMIAVALTVSAWRGGTMTVGATGAEAIARTTAAETAPSTTTDSQRERGVTGSTPTGSAGFKSRRFHNFQFKPNSNRKLTMNVKKPRKSPNNEKNHKIRRVWHEVHCDSHGSQPAQMELPKSLGVEFRGRKGKQGIIGCPACVKAAKA